jgi:hypothetical protein
LVRVIAPSRAQSYQQVLARLSLGLALIKSYFTILDFRALLFKEEIFSQHKLVFNSSLSESKQKFTINIKFPIN